MLELSIPGLFIAGVYASPHCATMCAGLNLNYAERPVSWGQAQALRVASYTVLGALAGGLGGLVLFWLPVSVSVSRVGVGLGLLLLAVVVWRANVGSSCCASKHRWRHTQRSKPWWAAAWGLMPCPALAVAAGGAAFSGGVAAGALLLLVFGLGTLPAHTSQMLLFRRSGIFDPRLVRRLGSAFIFLNGLWLITLWFLDDGSESWFLMCAL